MGIFDAKGVQNFCINLEGGNDAVRPPGSLVRGHVLIKTVTPAKYKSLYLRYIASVWYKDDGETVFEDKVAHYYTYLLLPEGTDSSIPGKAPGEVVGTLGCGELRYPFQFVIPHDVIPIRVDGVVIGTRHALNARLVREGSWFDNSQSVSLNVRTFAPRAQLQQLETDFTEDTVLPLRNSLFSTKGAMEVSTTISTTMIAADKPTPIRVRVRIDNAGGKKPVAANAVTAALKFTLRYTSRKNLKKENSKGSPSSGRGSTTPPPPGSPSGSGSDDTTAESSDPKEVDQLMSIFKRIDGGSVTLLGDPIPVGGHGVFEGSLSYAESNAVTGDAQHQALAVGTGGEGSTEEGKTPRGEGFTQNTPNLTFWSPRFKGTWAVEISINCCSKSQEIPIAIVGAVDETNVVPWFTGHEKVCPVLDEKQSYELPPLTRPVVGTVVVGGEEQARAAMIASVDDALDGTPNAGSARIRGVVATAEQRGHPTLVAYQLPPMPHRVEDGATSNLAGSRTATSGLAGENPCSWRTHKHEDDSDHNAFFH